MTTTMTTASLLALRSSLLATVAEIDAVVASRVATVGLAPVAAAPAAPAPVEASYARLPDDTWGLRVERNAHDADLAPGTPVVAVRKSGERKAEVVGDLVEVTRYARLYVKGAARRGGTPPGGVPAAAPAPVAPPVAVADDPF